MFTLSVGAAVAAAAAAAAVSLVISPKIGDIQILEVIYGVFEQQRA